MSIETLNNSISGLAGRSLSDLFRMSKSVANAIAGKLATDAADMAAYVGQVHDVWWQPDNCHYPAEIASIDIQLGLVIVKFVESNSEQDRTFGVSPSAIKLRSATAERRYSKS